MSDERLFPVANLRHTLLSDGRHIPPVQKQPKSTVSVRGDSVTPEYGEDREEPLILHCFADYGVESEALACYGNVVRVGIDAKDTNESIPIKADAYNVPISDDVTFDLGVFHPICKRWAELTSLSGNPDDHPNQIPQAREIAQQYCDHYVIENKPNAPLKDPVYLDGKMFGLPIDNERAFETSFPVTQPPRQKRFSHGGTKVETSPYFFSERSRRWWGSVKGYRESRYPKEHLAKNSIPAPYIHHICRDWLRVYEAANGETVDRPDYSNYDERMESRRRAEDNESIYKYVDGDPQMDRTLDSFADGEADSENTEESEDDD